MAPNSRSFSVRMFTLRLTTVVLFLSSAVTAVPERELESMLAVVRTRGYSLFCNALITSEVYYEVLAGNSFTLFAPTDSRLFALDMTATASDYIATLRYHVVPGRLSIAEVRSLPSGSTLHTLVPGHDIQLRRCPASDHTVTADGIDVVMPGLFYGRDIAVHGLGGILVFRSPIGLTRGLFPPPPVAPEADYRHSPHPASNWYGNHGSWPPVVEHRHNTPPPDVFTGDHGWPVVDYPHAPTPTQNLADPGRSEPPIFDGTDIRTALSPVPEPPNFPRFSPVDSPGKAGSPVEVSPESSFGPDFAPTTEPPAPSVPIASIPAAPSRSIGDKNAPPVEGWTPVRQWMGAPTTDNPWPFGPEETLDCPREESDTLPGHVCIHPGNPSLQQQTTLTCATSASGRSS